MMIPDWLEEALSKPTTDIPTAGRALGLSRNGAYDAARRGEIKTMRFGRLQKVPTAWLRRVLELDSGRAA